METTPEFWLDKPYYSLDAYCKKTFGHKCYKIALNAHMTCPNRDGSLGTRGCIFCSKGGSGDFAEDFSLQNDINIQLEKGLSRFGDKKTGQHFIAYFQAYTNTYAPVSYLEQIYRAALDSELVCGISIATRPDALPPEVLGLLQSLKQCYPAKFIWVELGLQTIHEQTAEYIRRGYSLPVYEEAVGKLSDIGIPVITHMIIGLPGETPAMLYETVDYLNRHQPFGVKLQLLHVLKDTDLATEYSLGRFDVLSMEAYLDLLVDCIERLSPDIVLHRVTGDGPKDMLIAPLWSLNKRNVLNSLHQKMSREHSRQGKRFEG